MKTRNRGIGHVASDRDNNVVLDQCNKHGSDTINLFLPRKHYIRKKEEKQNLQTVMW